MRHSVTPRSQPQTGFVDLSHIGNSHKYYAGTFGATGSPMIGMAVYPSQIDMHMSGSESRKPGLAASAY